MSDAAETPQPLEYLQPIYVGRQSYRSRNVLFAFIVIVFFEMGWFWASEQARFQQSHGRLIFKLLGIPFALVALWLAVAIVLDLRQTVFVIEPGGIKFRRKLVPWEKIRRFGACVHPVLFWKSLQLFYCTQPYPMGFQLLNSDPISQQDYEHLIEQLRDVIGYCRDLQLGGYEKIVSTE